MAPKKKLMSWRLGSSSKKPRTDEQTLDLPGGVMHIEGDPP